MRKCTLYAVVRKVRAKRSAEDVTGRLCRPRQGDLDGPDNRPINGCLFEDDPASVLNDTPLVHGQGFAVPDDDFYYEMVAIRAFEKYGIEMTVDQLAAQLILPLSPYRKCIGMVISMAEAGKQQEEIYRVINEHWGIEYPATNNAVLNGGFVATSIWFGEGDFSKTENLAFSAADFADTDCNAANSAPVVASMHGMSALTQLILSTSWGSHDKRSVANATGIDGAVFYEESC